MNRVSPPVPMRSRGRRRILRERLRKLLAEARVQAFLIDLARFVETRGWLVPQDFGQTERLAAPVVELAGKALNKRWKKVGKRARGLATLDAEQRHELRKELKTLRYAVEFFSSLYPAKHVDPFLKRLKKLQTVFGDLNDAATVRAHVDGSGSARRRRSGRATRHRMGDRGEPGARRIWLGWRKSPVAKPRGNPPLLEVTNERLRVSELCEATLVKGPANGVVPAAAPVGKSMGCIYNAG